jgi:hypothetical protein
MMTPILHKALVVYVLAAMNFWLPMPRWRAAEYHKVAEAIVDATPDPEEEIQLAAIGSLESGYSVSARGKLGEIGVWQHLPMKGFPVPKSLVGQAKLAVYKWFKMGRCSYTGESNRADHKCPLADNRYLRAFDYSRTHPFVMEQPIASR